MFPSGARTATGKPMAYRELTMIEVKEVLRRVAAGQSARRIARETGIDRKTAGRYIAAGGGDGVDAKQVAEAVQSRPRPQRSEQYHALFAHKGTLEKWIGGDAPLRLRAASP